MGQLWPFLNKEALHSPLSNSCPGHHPFGLLQCTLHGKTLENYPEVSAGTECSFMDNFRCSKNGACNTSSFLSYIACQFASKFNSRYQCRPLRSTWHGTRLPTEPSLFHYFSPSHPVRQGRYVEDPVSQRILTGGDQEINFPQRRGAPPPTFLVFHRSMKTWLCNLACVAEN